jgi:hypothetical protein
MSSAHFYLSGLPYIAGNEGLKYEKPQLLNEFIGRSVCKIICSHTFTVRKTASIVSS